MSLNAARPQAPDSRSPREFIVRDIIRGLYEGRYLPGQRLVEAGLTAHYRVSRGPVREALNWLAARGVVSLTLQRGGEVRLLSREDAVDVLVVVESLIGLAAGLAALRAESPGAVSGLRSSLSRLEEFDPSSGTPEYAHARDSFYGTLLDIAGNAELRRIMPGTLVHLVRVQYRDALRAVGPSRHADYHAIARAVLSRQPMKAEAAARAHIGKMIAVLAPPPQRDWGRNLSDVSFGLGLAGQSPPERSRRRKRRRTHSKETPVGS